MIGVPVDWLAAGFVGVYDPLRFIKRRMSPKELMQSQIELDSRNGRPRNDTSRTAATVACYFYEAWRGENKKRGTNDYGHRREKVAAMKWDDINNETWSVPNFNRQKGTGGDLVLPQAALDKATLAHVTPLTHMCLRQAGAIGSNSRTALRSFPRYRIGFCTIYAAQRAR